MANKNLTIEVALDILNKFYRVTENDGFYSSGKWYIKYNRNNNNNESDFHALEERFLFYSGDMPKLIGPDEQHFAISSGNKLFWENDIKNMTIDEFVELCNEEFKTILNGTEENKLYKAYAKKCIEEENKRTQEIQEKFDINQRKAKTANIIFNTILFIIMIIVLRTLITAW